MTTVVVAGVAVLDFVFTVDDMPRSAEKYRAKDAKIVGGGGAANAAVAIARLGGNAKLATRLGQDQIAGLILDDLSREGVDCSMVKQFPGKRSSFSSIFVDSAGERQIVNFRDFDTGSEVDWITAGDLAHVNAALADTRWPSGGAAVMRIAREMGVPAVVDAEAPFEHAGDILRTATHIAFSTQGLRAYAGDDDDLERGLSKAAAATGAWVCVTAGEAGVAFLGDGKFGRVPAYPVEAIDTLAAGDVWHGAFTLRLAEGAPETEAIRFANAAAALKCQTRGGRDGAPDRIAVEEFMRARGAAR